MNLAVMSYKSFYWENNPTSLTVTLERSVKETLLPFVGSRTTDMGAKKRRITGEGFFTGDNCWEKWRELKSVYEEGGAGSLHLPNQEPFDALMDSLTLIGVSGQNLIKYRFSFTETGSKEKYGGSGMYTACEGETLWDYAHMYGREIDDLVRANPHIRDISYLSDGEEVLIP